MTTHEELPKAYDPKNVDPRWYQFWLDLNLFKANAKSEKPSFCVVIPPPNVTGVLHMGHALVNTLQDVVIRWKRMSGFEALWVPGTDHAGIATQTVVERHLFKTTGKKRTDFTREEFLEHTWKWKEENEHNILNQLKKLGCSCDWSRLRFTMDEGNNRAVKRMFKKLFDEGLIYRGDYLVNWDPVTQTALADDEVEYEERQGFLWYFKYPLEDGTGHISIATTRPETMLGDTAIGVSPKDPRYFHLIGKNAIQPLTKRKLLIFADPFIDPEFGTGAVKITPAHDPNDYKMGISHNLPFVNIMTVDGKVNENGGEFQGLPFDEARKRVVNAMKTQSLLEKIDPHVNRVGIAYRSKAVIEPFLSKQWFVKMSDFAKTLKEVVNTKKVKLIPENWEATYFHWIDNLRDWCISRQLWWGHQIPIWYKINDPETMICSEEEIPEEVKKNPHEWVQDPDVLDTWFSAGLWPFATLGWPDETEDLKRFYPNSTLITGYDILFFWVARMIAMGSYAMGKPPFPETFLHGLIYGKSYWRNNPGGGITYVSTEERQGYDLGKPVPPDVQFKWEKMSKTKGNVVDPIEVIDEYGTDAIRMALCASAPQSREIDLDRRRFEEFRNFANKVWNGARFVLMNLTPEDKEPLTMEEFEKGIDLNALALEDRWILTKLNSIVRDVNKHLEQYQFEMAALKAYDFFWKEFCAYYVEFSKPYLFGKVGSAQDRKLKQKILLIVLNQAIRLLHPMAPFITEELFQILKKRFISKSIPKNIDPLTSETLTALQSKACAVAPFPKTLDVIAADDLEKQFNTIEEIIYTIRNVRGEMKLPPGAAIRLIILGSEKDHAYSTLKKHPHLIEALIKTQSIEFVTEDPHEKFASMGIVDKIKLIIPFPKEQLDAEKQRLKKEAEKLNLNISKLQTQLSNTEFVEKAPPALILKQREQLAQSQKEHHEILQKLSHFG